MRLFWQIWDLKMAPTEMIQDQTCTVASQHVYCLHPWNGWNTSHSPFLVRFHHHLLLQSAVQRFLQMLLPCKLSRRQRNPCVIESHVCETRSVPFPVFESTAHKYIMLHILPKTREAVGILFLLWVFDPLSKKNHSNSLDNERHLIMLLSVNNVRTFISSSFDSTTAFHCE